MSENENVTSKIIKKNKELSFWKTLILIISFFVLTILLISLLSMFLTGFR